MTDAEQHALTQELAAHASERLPVDLGFIVITVRVVTDEPAVGGPLRVNMGTGIAAQDEERALEDALLTALSLVRAQRERN